MNDRIDTLERMISRVIDGEATIAERRELDRRLRDDPAAHELYEEYTAFDREIGAALRSDARRTARPRRLLFRIAQAGSLAAAACIAVVLMWQAPPRETNPASRVDDNSPVYG